MTRGEKGSNTGITHSVREEKERSNPVTVMFTREELEQYTRGLSKKLQCKRQKQRIKNRKSYRTTNYKLINQMNESMEQRRLEIDAAREEPASSFWSRLFNRK
jgi:hypothetical protein